LYYMEYQSEDGGDWASLMLLVAFLCH